MGERPAQEAVGRAGAGRGDAEEDAGRELAAPGVRCTTVTWAIKQQGYSQRRACGLVGLEPETYRYASKLPGDGEIRARLRVLAGERRRFGYSVTRRSRRSFRELA